MTNLATIQIKSIAAAIEAIDADDVKDAELAVRLIRAILEGGGEKKGEGK